MTKITTEYCGREYEHGSVEVTQKSGIEWSIEINANLVINRENLEELHEKIQEVIREFAI